MRSKKLRTVLSVLAVLAFFCLVLAGVTRLLEPKYMTDLVEGSFISQYYDEAGGHDVIFIGDCEVYANFSPAELWRQRGITAYVRGTSQQLVWQSYYVLEETLQYETPKVVVFNVNAMRYGEAVNEAYHRLTIDQMRWSKSKVGIIQASMTEEETFLSYVFPILRYHSRFDELTSEDFEYYFKTKQNTFNGYQMNTNVVPLERLPAKRPLANYDFAPVCWEYLNKMADLCQEKGVELVLIKAPSRYPYWYEQYDAQIRQFAQERGLSFYNLQLEEEAIGLDFSTDTYDAGLHLNLSGATKLSVWFADILADNHGCADHRMDRSLATQYTKLLERYDKAAGK